jgi:hypothetical protein
MIQIIEIIVTFAKILFWSWQVCHILLTYGQILTLIIIQCPYSVIFCIYLYQQ